MIAAGATSKTQPVVTPARVEYAIRNRFNPIRDFSPERLATQLDLFHTGHIKDAARTWEAMERRDIYLGNVAAKRKKSVARLPWEILTTDESELAQKQAEYLEAFYNSIRVTSVLEQNERGGVALLIRQMMDAVGKKFAVHEIVWRPNASSLPPLEMKDGQEKEDGQEEAAPRKGLSAEFRFCPLWWFENKTGRLKFLPEESAVDGETMPPGEWVVTVGEGIMESCSVAYAYKHLPLKDWLAYSEKYGMPGLLGKTQAAKDSAEWTAMEEAVENFMNDWAAVCSVNDALELVEVKGGTGNLPFPPLVEYCDRAMASRWRGADLSTISAGTGEGQGASLQGDETNLLLQDDARMLSEALNEQVDRFVIGYAFGEGTEVKAYFKLLAPSASEKDAAFRRDIVKQFLTDKTVSDMLANLTDLKELVGEVGLPVNQEYIEPYIPVVAESGPMVTGEKRIDSEGDIVGGEKESDPQPVPGGPELDGEKAGLPGVPNDRQSQISNFKRALARGVQKDFKGVAERLQVLAARANNGTLGSGDITEFLADLPDLRRALANEGEAATALKEALLEGLVQGRKAQRGGGKV